MIQRTHRPASNLRPCHHGNLPRLIETRGRKNYREGLAETWHLEAVCCNFIGPRFATAIEAMENWGLIDDKAVLSISKRGRKWAAA